MYLGDGVYAQWNENSNQLFLTTGCHFNCKENRPHNTLVLDPEVINEFELYIKKLKQLLVSKTELPDEL